MSLLYVNSKYSSSFFSVTTCHVSCSAVLATGFSSLCAEESLDSQLSISIFKLHRDLSNQGQKSPPQSCLHLRTISIASSRDFLVFLDALEGSSLLLRGAASSCYLTSSSSHTLLLDCVSFSSSSFFLFFSHDIFFSAFFFSYFLQPSFGLTHCSASILNRLQEHRSSDTMLTFTYLTSFITLRFNQGYKLNTPPSHVATAAELRYKLLMSILQDFSGWQYWRICWWETICIS